MNAKIETTEDVSGLGLVKGFKVAGIGCDIRGKNDMSRLDTALIFSECDASGSGVFTTNDVKAAPVMLDMKRVSGEKKLRAIVANSGNANACTGERGFSDAQKTCEITAKELGISADEVLVCSTGRIGEFLPMDKLERGIKEAVVKLSNSDEASKSAAGAILTSDTRPKTVISRATLSDGRKFSVAGMAKGAGMIEPHMATMLSFIVTDAKVAPELLKEVLKSAASRTFNKMTVDGDMSTNDTVLILANGASNVEIAESDAEALEAFKKAVLEVCWSLARKIVGDGEKITKVVEVKVRGARDYEQAEKICRAIGNSLLVKSSWYGADPNWGRLTDAAGYARTGLDFEKLDLYYNTTPVILKGQPKPEFKSEWKKIVSNKNFTVDMNLNLGDECDTILAADLTEGYVNFNKGE